mgnify:CR=1 FL=1
MTTTTWRHVDTSGYLDTGPSCDECWRCDCEPCPTGDVRGQGWPELWPGAENPECENQEPHTICVHFEQDDAMASYGCIGLTSYHVHMDGGESLCDECYEWEV